MIFESPKDAVPWVGLYTAIASLICTLAMAADVIHAVRQWKLWFPNKFFTLNAATITLIAVAMKLPVDLTSEVYPSQKGRVYGVGVFYETKIYGVYFLVTMLANLLPSLGLMDERELLTNIIALGILVITIDVNVFIQMGYTFSVVLIFFTLCLFSVALMVSTTRKKLEHRYKESQQLVSCHQQKMFSSKEHKRHVKRYWMMTETRNPQFVIAYSPVSSAYGVFCAFIAASSFFTLLSIISSIMQYGYLNFAETDYKWSLKIIVAVQLIGILVGSIAPVFRCLTSIGHYNLSKKWSQNQLNVFRVEKHWIQTLKKWKTNHIHSNIPGRHSKIVFHYTKNTVLNFCIAIHIAVLVTCKILCLVPRTFLLLLSCCWVGFKSLWKWFKKIANASSTSNLSSELEEYTMYVVQIEEEAKLSNRTLRNTLRTITQVLDDSVKKEPSNLIKLLGRSSCFNGVVKFDNNQFPPLYLEEPRNCWSLVVVTLTSIAIALPNIAKGHFKELLDGMKEGLQIVRHVEECLNVDGDSMKARKAARRLWAEVEVYRTWLQIELQKKARKRKTSKEILTWLGDEAAKIVIQSKSTKKPSIDHSPFKFIVASSMYRISQTILLQCNQQANVSNDELFEWISTTIADILSACFTNLPRVIQLSCHHHAIEKRGDNIQNAARLLGKSKKILKMLKKRQLPNMDLDSMAYIDKWCVLTMSQMPNGSNNGASTRGVQQVSSTSNGSLTITIM